MKLAIKTLALFAALLIAPAAWADSPSDAPCTTPATTAQCSQTSLLKSIVNGIIAAIPSGTNIIGKVGIDQTTPGTTNGVQVNAALPAGENHVGQVGGTSTRVMTTPTVQNAAYALNNCVGGFNPVTVARINGGTGLVNSISVKSISGQTPTITVYVFDANPSASTCTDKSTFTLNSTDADKLIAAPFALTLSAPTGTTTTFAEVTNMARTFIAGGATNSGVKTLYFALVAGGAFTPGSTTDIRVGFQAVLD